MGIKALCNESKFQDSNGETTPTPYHLVRIGEGAFGCLGVEEL